METEIIHPFVEGAIHILDTTASVKLKARPPFIKTNQDHLGDISGILEIAGDINGSVVISFSKKSILGIVSDMFGEEMTEMNDDIKDAVGEICNMIAGQVTTKIASLNKKAKVTLKEICTGKDQKIEHLNTNAAKVLALPFATTKGKLIMEISYSQ